MASTSGKNRSILAGLVGPSVAPMASPAPAPVTDTPMIGGDEATAGSPAADAPVTPPPRVNDRMLGIARLTSGEYQEKTLKLVDPARCRMWERHNRDYSLLNADNCADLLESLRAQNKQEFPALVRRIEGDPDYDFEVIFGARRHWSVSYLRTVEHRDIKYLVEERELTDEAAFRLADLENRARRDISDYERAVDYLNAIDLYYGGVARRMAERLDVPAAWLSRFLDLGKLPQDVVAAFGDHLQLREKFARDLKPFLTQSPERGRMLSAAKKLAAEQTQRHERGEPYLEAPKVVSALKNAALARVATESAPSGETRVVKAGAVTLFTVKPKGPAKVVLELALDAGASNADFVAALQAELMRLRPDA